MKIHILKTMRSHLISIVIISIIAMSASFLLAGCGSNELDSQWREVEVTIDGVNTEWIGNTVYFEDPGAVVGMLNDDDFLYVCLMSSNRDVLRQVMMSGLTIWVDQKNNKKKLGGLFSFLIAVSATSLPASLAFHLRERPIVTSNLDFFKSFMIVASRPL